MGSTVGLKLGLEVLASDGANVGIAGTCDGAEVSSCEEGTTVGDRDGAAVGATVPNGCVDPLRRTATEMGIKTAIMPRRMMTNSNAAFFLLTLSPESKLVVSSDS